MECRPGWGFAVEQEIYIRMRYPPPVGNLYTNNAKRLVKWAAGQIKLGRPEPLWYDCIAHLHPPLAFAAAPCGHRMQNGDNPAATFKPEKIVFPEDFTLKQHFHSRPVDLTDSFGQAPLHQAPIEPEAPISTGHPVEPTAVSIQRATEELSARYMREEKIALEQSQRQEAIKDSMQPSWKKVQKDWDKRKLRSQSQSK